MSVETLSYLLDQAEAALDTFCRVQSDETTAKLLTRWFILVLTIYQNYSDEFIDGDDPTFPTYSLSPSVPRSLAKVHWIIHDGKEYYGWLYDEKKYIGTDTTFIRSFLNYFKYSFPPPNSKKDSK